MKPASLRFKILLGLGLTGCALALALPQSREARAQQPTGSIPTVTGTPLGPYVTVNLDLDFVNVRSGPNEYLYPKIGILMRGQSAPALARSPDLTWIQIYYAGVPGNIGWIYAPNVRLVSSGFLPVVEPPPTPTLPAPTVNPTLESAYQSLTTPTRLPTFTPPAPIENPAFADETDSTPRVPLGLIVLILGGAGFLVAAASLLRGR
ncbi:MAG: hypothetical protein DPW21_08335 [Anaerolineae bacterium]|jgi:hypothetical protein|nr:hypothetical protein [Anaerolineales bacterium]MCC7512227.1 hypothetical protein [Anaerolineae bacterium]MCE7918134.1 SH3 domain-containing protein [Chloroflexi bacterium CFX1]OQY80311.1 MAG: hypothetical protein B6D40_13155 [Anaerolineae bacterium UTCFX3]GER80412.1 conserved hypothetical protein [Candidatus Denitrolinea symbiosum]